MFKDKPVSVNVDFINKATKKELIDFSSSFLACEINAEDLARFIENGFSFCTVFNGTRKKSNFVKAGFIALDFDTWNIEDCINHPYTKNAVFMYTTASHTKEQHKFRLVFELEEIITCSKKYENTVMGLLEIYKKADKACKDCVRMFYGSLGAEIKFFNGLLTKSKVKILQFKSIKIKKQYDNKDTKLIKEFEIEEEITREKTVELLKKIGTMPGYEIWRNVCWALYSYFGNSAYEIINSWSPDDSNGAVIKKLFNTYDGRIKIGTLIYYAKNL